APRVNDRSIQPLRLSSLHVANRLRELCGLANTGMVARRPVFKTCCWRERSCSVGVQARCSPRAVVQTADVWSTGWSRAQSIPSDRSKTPRLISRTNRLTMKCRAVAHCLAKDGSTRSDVCGRKIRTAQRRVTSEALHFAQQAALYAAAFQRR